jgi:hypothetical protein
VGTIFVTFKIDAGPGCNAEKLRFRQYSGTRIQDKREIFLAPGELDIF